MTLPADIKETFFQTLYGDKSVLDFEQWLYMDKRLESTLTPEDYLDLISYGYKGDRVKYGLYKLLEKHIDKGEYEKWKLLRILNRALQRDNDLPKLLMLFYDLYCKGYNFLDNLGLGYGLAVEVPYSQADSWDELTPTQQKKLLDSFYPDIENEIKKVIEWLQTDKVVLTGIQDEYNHYEYIDNRTDDEKKPTAFKVTTIETTTTKAYTDTVNSVNSKPWWKFW
jgi:hypothetical protein